jgi:hypothetical protein
MHRDQGSRGDARPTAQGTPASGALVAVNVSRHRAAAAVVDQADLVWCRKSPRHCCPGQSRALSKRGRRQLGVGHGLACSVTIWPEQTHVPLASRYAGGLMCGTRSPDAGAVRRSQIVHMARVRPLMPLRVPAQRATSAGRVAA